MIIVAKKDVTEQQIESIAQELSSKGLILQVNHGKQSCIIGLCGDVSAVDPGSITSKYPFVEQVLKVSEPYKKANRRFKPDDTVIKVGIDSGYYYIFEKVNNRYKVYRSSIENGINKTYLFETDSKELLYVEDTVYYKDGKYLKKYNNQNGNQIVIENKELEFNKNIKIGLYTK